VDWKALSHAVRVGREAVELFETGAIVFPLRCADRLLQIKRGVLPYQDVATEIETLLEEVEAAAAHSRLPREPRLDLMEEIVASAYRKRIGEAKS
jgi:predicted RNase H-like nuclease